MILKFITDQRKLQNFSSRKGAKTPGTKRDFRIECIPSCLCVFVRGFFQNISPCKEWINKKILFGFFLLLLFGGLTSAQQPWWFTLEQGKQYFRSGSYGNALIAFEDARRSRLDQFTRMEQDLILLLSNPNVRPLGDSLEFVERYIDANKEAVPAAALAELYYRIPKDSLGGSVKRALEEIDRLKSYPEADYWLGEAYKAEGELSMALRQYQRAWENRILLETPGFETEILHKITDIHRMRREYQEMEKQANEIIEGNDSSGNPRDIYWAKNSSGSSSLTQVRSAMARILENEGVNRFLTLYRYSNNLTEKTHRLLGFFYYASNRYSPAAEHLMFAFLIQNTVIIDNVVRSEFDFTFTSLEDLLASARSRVEINAYLEDTEYYRTIYYLASALYATGKARPASQLWSFLASSSAAGEWGNRARRYPGPFIDRAIEMP